MDEPSIARAKHGTAAGSQQSQSFRYDSDMTKDSLGVIENDRRYLREKIILMSRFPISAGTVIQQVLLCSAPLSSRRGKIIFSKFFRFV